ncbi:Uncharacterized protein conserved in bacteria (DUF2237) [Seminavis robusta]|uniref:Uncharacterized protein conserved in bacteria (DUF2237) n=1 Tax=Seminavis robusta TaxID=568900 RepID=A0A9N8E0E3_9STRA|nr:Uncharacterized protein conserved in bacteria (DUF2237) [Seminavis robusta]|eukprot:Sro521_g159390.1 Uncharacterized protein conserved in bacteria (DUF2237) (227) ;mRNA; r:39254-39934
MMLLPMQRTTSAACSAAVYLAALVCFLHTVPVVSFHVVSPPPTQNQLFNPIAKCLTCLHMAFDDEADDDEPETTDPTGPQSVNVLGTPLKPCCTDVGGSGIGTGFYRNGYCSTGEQDLGRHTVCVQVTDDFLQFSQAVGNDLSTPVPQYMFPGLKEGDIWCLCAQRWAQAYQNGKAPKLFLQATHEKTLDFASFEVLREFALDKEEADQRLDDLNEQRERLKKLLD